MHQKWIIVYAVFALIGLADAAYLSMMHFYQADVGCSLISGCDAVLSSEYATIAGIPLAYLGLLYYLSLLVLTGLYYQTDKPVFLKALLGINLSGFAFSLWLVYLQAFVIEAFCQFCLISALVTTVLLGIVSFLLYKDKK
jgi:uncharacterized membrane protein